MTSANAESHRRAVERWEQKGVKWGYCGDAIAYEHRYPLRKFCSQTCNVSFNNGKRRKLQGSVYCLCGNVVKVTVSRKRHCSVQCQEVYRDAEFIARIEALPAPPSHNMAKKYLLKKEGHKCKICGLAKWLGKPIALVLDHVDGNAACHSWENIRLICNNCDAQTPTYKALNKGNGRAYRRNQDTIYSSRQAAKAAGLHPDIS